MPGELAPVLLDPSTVILVCKSNPRAVELAAEVRGKSNVKVVDAARFLSDRRSLCEDVCRTSDVEALAQPSHLSQLSEMHQPSHQPSQPPLEPPQASALPEESVPPEPPPPSQPPRPSFLELAPAAHGEGSHRPSRPGLYLLLYLNKDTFLDEGEETARCVRAALTGGIRVVLIHEMDPERGGVPFRVFFANTPEDLMIQHGLYNTLAVPLYSSPPYRAVSKILIRKAMGGVRVRPKVSKLALRVSRHRLRSTSNRSLDQLSETAWMRTLGRIPAAQTPSGRGNWRAPWSPKLQTVDSA